MRGVLYSGSPDLGIKEKLRTLRKIRVAYDARVKEIYRIQGQIASGRSRESTVSFEDASRQINKIMDENPPWLEFEKLLGPEGGRSSKSDLSLHRSIHNALADRINKSSFIDPGMKESRNDLAYLTRIASAHSMRDNASRGKYYLLAKHSPWAIESMLNGTYIDLDKDLSTTVVWDGIPCTLYAEKRHQGRSGFGVVYNPENLKFKYGEFYAYATFGVSPVDRVVKMGSVTGTYDLKVVL